MSDANPGSAEAPARTSNWLKYALVASLAVNLLFIGGAAARFYTYGPPERMSGISQMQLIPRKFLGELDRGRRSELLKVFREYGPSFKEGSRAAREEVVSLAAALEAEPYDAERVRTIVDGFSARSSDLVRSGGDAALKIISMLSQDERKLLAQQIRMRDDSGHRRNSPKRDDND
jgi:uncharacterized membrane protein